MNRDLHIETPRLHLRSPRRSDFKVWHALREASRDHLRPWEPLWSHEANTREDWRMRLRAWRRNLRQERGFVFLVFSRQGGALLGGVSLSNVRRGPVETGTLGYWLGASVTGHGYMTEAVGALCLWSKTWLKLARIEAATLPENLASQNVLKRCGFQKEGLAEKYLQIAGERRDHVLYGLSLDTL